MKVKIYSLLVFAKFFINLSMLACKCRLAMVHAKEQKYISVRPSFNTGPQNAYTAEKQAITLLECFSANFWHLNLHYMDCN